MYRCTVVQWSCCFSLSSLTPAPAAWGEPWWVWPHRSPCSCRRGQERTDRNRNVNKSELMHSHLQWLLYDSFDIPTIYLTVVKKLDTFLEKRKGCNIFFLVLWVTVGPHLDKYYISQTRLLTLNVCKCTTVSHLTTDLSNFKQFAELSKDAKFKCTYNWLNFYHPNSQFINNFLSFGAIIKAKIDWLMETAGDLFFWQSWRQSVH